MVLSFWLWLLRKLRAWATTSSARTFSGILGPKCHASVTGPLERAGTLGRAGALGWMNLPKPALIFFAAAIFRKPEMGA